MGCPFHRSPVVFPLFTCHEDIEDDGDGDDADQHAVEPLNKDLEHRVAMVLSTRVNLVGVGLPVGCLLGFGNRKMPGSKACWPFGAGFTGVVDSNRTTDDDDEQSQHGQHQRKGGWTAPPRGFHDSG